MKKVISISMVIAILFAFTACSSKEYIDVPVTDADGQAVTDENGEAVTERVLKADTTASSKDESSTAAASSGKSTSANQQDNNNKTSNASQGNNTTKKADNKNTTTKKETTKKQTTTKPTTTVKAEKRDVKVTVYIPTFSDVKTEEELKTELTLYYRVKGDKKWKKAETKKDITLEYNKDGSQKKEEFKIKGLTGEFEFRADFKGVEGIKNNTAELAADKKECTITPTTGIENIVGSTGNGWI